MDWFGRLCRSTGLLVHDIVKPVSDGAGRSGSSGNGGDARHAAEATDARPTDARQARSRTEQRRHVDDDGRTVTVRRTTIEEVEVREPPQQ